MSRPRDIDYAAIAVKKAIVEKFGRHNELEDLEVTAHERTISVLQGDRTATGSRDNLLAAIRKADSYAALWQLLPTAGESVR
jgi:hypothetical protein